VQYKLRRIRACLELNQCLPIIKKAFKTMKVGVAVKCDVRCGWFPVLHCADVLLSFLCFFSFRFLRHI
jgi:hypothetical protein